MSKKPLMDLIDQEIAHALAGEKAKIIIKTNSLSNKEMIDKLIEASQAGAEFFFYLAGFPLYIFLLLLLSGFLQLGRKIIKQCNLAVKDHLAFLPHRSTVVVEILLLVRGICCLQVGIPGVSDNITIKSIVGRQRQVGI